MRIEVDKKAYRHQETRMVGVKQELRIVGMHQEGVVYITPDTTIELMANLCHEIGHGFHYFSGSRYVNLLISYSKALSAKINLSAVEIDYLKQHLFSSKERQADEVLLSIIAKAFAIITKNNRNVSRIKVYPESNKGLHNRVFYTGTMSAVRLPDRSLNILNSKRTRNHEVPAYYIQFLACQVIENTIRETIDPNFTLHFAKEPSVSHRRAKQLPTDFS